MPRAATDNTHISYKLRLRETACKDLYEKKVLDLYGGFNTMWNQTGTDYYYYSIDVDNVGVNVRADNVRVIPSLDLSRFNIIDCDAYGTPYSQIKSVLENPTLASGTVVLFTFICSQMKAQPKHMSDDYNIPDWMPTGLKSQLAPYIFLDFLKRKNIDRIIGYKLSDKGQVKMYGYFIVP